MDTQQIVNLIICVILFVVLALFASGVAGKAVVKRRNHKSPRLGAEVEVISKKAEAHARGKMVYSAVFRLKDDNKLEFEIPEESFKQLREGDFVKIIFKGNVFEGFKPLENPQNTNIPESETSEKQQVTEITK